MSHSFYFSFIIKFFFLIILLANNKVKSQDFKTLSPKVLEEETELLEVKDYDNINLVITKKSLYSGINPELKFTFENEFQSNTVFATYNSEFILSACTNNNLLSYFNVTTFEEKSIFTYNSFNILPTNSTCSISVLKSYALILHTNITGSIMYLTFVRIKLKVADNRIQLDSSPESYKTNISLNSSEEFSRISCEAILPKNSQDNDFISLVCAYLKYNNITGKYSYVANTLDLNMKK